MTLPEGVEVALVAAEPDVRQTIFVKHDDRGRLWTIQYLQYPNPAGLERVEVDRWSRTTDDRVPEPPPHGPRGADRITICEDRDGDGRADTFRDFLDGLPAHLRDTFIAGNFLGHSISWWRVVPRGSTFDAADGGLLLDAHDTWFGPTDLAVGPGGTLAVSDFHDARTAHPDPDAAWAIPPRPCGAGRCGSSAIAGRSPPRPPRRSWPSHAARPTSPRSPRSPPRPGGWPTTSGRAPATPRAARRSSPG